MFKGLKFFIQLTGLGALAGFSAMVGMDAYEYLRKPDTQAKIKRVATNIKDEFKKKIES